jgi:hypothetical protein
VGICERVVLLLLLLFIKVLLFSLELTISMVLRFVDIALKVERLEEVEMGEELLGLEEEGGGATLSPPKGVLASVEGLLNGTNGPLEEGGGMGLGNFANTLAKVARRVYMGSIMFCNLLSVVRAIDEFCNVEIGSTSLESLGFTRDFELGPSSTNSCSPSLCAVLVLIFLFFLPGLLIFTSFSLSCVSLPLLGVGLVFLFFLSFSLSAPV